MSNSFTAEQRQYYTLELLLHSPNLPSSLLNSLIPSSYLPPNINRLFLLRNLLSSNPLQILQTLNDLLPPSSPPSPAFYNAYASSLFHVSISPTVSASEAAACVNRVREYGFGSVILRRVDELVGMMDDGSGVGVRVANAKNKASLAVKEFVDEELRVLGPPFLVKAAEAFLRAEGNDNKNEAAHTNLVRNDLVQHQDVPKEKDKMEIIKRKISQIISDENQDNSTKKSKLRFREICTEKDHTKPILKKNELNPNPNRPIGRDTQENQDLSAKKNKLNGENYAEKTKELNPDPNDESIRKNTEENMERTEMRGEENNRGQNVNDPCTSHANDTNKEGQNGKKPSLMDRNPTARTFEWDEAIEEEREMERANFLPKKRESKFKKESFPFRKRRQKRKWTEQETEALIKAVRKVGKGNWQQMVDMYGDEFDDRTAVDLKDKWRNMGY